VSPCSPTALGTSDRVVDSTRQRDPA
jgi:hypothetical protein